MIDGMTTAINRSDLSGPVRKAMISLAVAVNHFTNNPQQRWATMGESAHTQSPCVYCHLFEMDGVTWVCYVVKQKGDGGDEYYFEHLPWQEFKAHHDDKGGSELFLVTMNFGAGKEGSGGGDYVYGTTEIGYGPRVGGSSVGEPNGRVPVALVAKLTGSTITLDSDLCNGEEAALEKWRKLGHLIPCNQSTTAYHRCTNLHRSIAIIIRASEIETEEYTGPKLELIGFDSEDKHAVLAQLKIQLDEMVPAASDPARAGATYVMVGRPMGSPDHAGSLAAHEEMVQYLVNGAIVIAAKSERDGFQSVFSIARNAMAQRKKRNAEGRGGGTSQSGMKQRRQCGAAWRRRT
jgi:hypothetical protein